VTDRDHYDFRVAKLIHETIVGAEKQSFAVLHFGIRWVFDRREE